MMLPGDFETLFDVMESYRAEHPEATDEECFEAVCLWSIDKTEARIDALKEDRRDSSIYA